ncbi:MAG: hypothetical protein KDA80_19350 [Planctomycetaceae bacterium]|nr:hypothetical protein [Planctomycetaceae bacterium]
MPIDHLMMPFMACLILMMTATTTALAGHVSLRPPETRSSQSILKQSLQREGTITKINVEERTLTIKSDDGKETKYAVAPAAEVTKNDREVSFANLVKSDFAVLHLASANSTVVTRIQAIARQ